jgi:hypothetical protein
LTLLTQTLCQHKLKYLYAMQQELYAMLGGDGWRFRQPLQRLRWNRRRHLKAETTEGEVA